MTRKEAKVLDAIQSLGGEASSLDIYKQLVTRAGYRNTFIGAVLGAIFGPSLGGMYATLTRLEKRSIIFSRWGAATAKRGWRRSRIYRIIGTQQTGESTTRIPHATS